MTSAPTPLPDARARLVSLDAYRGFVMLLMMGEVLRFGSVARALPGNIFWAFLAYHQTHVEWVGCSLHDLIQPSFSFIVGAALPFSISARLSRGQTHPRMTLHAFWRAFLLIALGIFLRSIGKTQTYFTFEDTLTQIGLGYGFLFLLGFRSPRDQWIAFGVLLLGYWAAFALYPLPGPAFDYRSVGVSPVWLSQHGLAGFSGHWNKSSNLAWAFDTWFLNLFPREKPFAFNVGGYSTLSFIPTLATMILGLIAGGVLRSDKPAARKIRWLALVGIVGIAAGWLLGALGICPMVKRIWTPSWTLFSGGWCCIITGIFYAIVDVANRKRWAFPLVVVGVNSIAAYCMAHLIDNFISTSLLIHFGEGAFAIFGKIYEPVCLGAVTLLILWLILFWMQRRKIFLRI